MHVSYHEPHLFGDKGKTKKGIRLAVECLPQPN